MFEQSIKVFETTFGPNAKPTDKVLRWLVRPDVGLVIEKPTRGSQQTLWAWVPYVSTTSPPNKATHYGSEKGRHSNAYSMPGLRKGMPAYRVPLERPGDVEALVDYLLDLPPIRDVA